MRKSLFLIDIIIFGWFGLMLILSAMGAVFGSGEHLGSLLAHLLPALAIYFALSRAALAMHRRQQAGHSIPKWLMVLGFAGMLAPFYIVPATFLQIGQVLEDNGWVQPISEHPDFDPNTIYDPDHAGEAGLQLGPYGGATYDDLELKNLDKELFGVYPPEWAKKFHRPWLSGLMQLGYLFYYLAPILAAVPLLFQKRWEHFRQAAAVIGGCILSTYIGYFFVPAAGPRFEGGIEAWLPAEPGWFGAETIYRAIDSAETFRWNAFPSGHVAVSIACLLVALRFNRKIGYAMIVPVLFLCMATIYMGYHYGTDVIAGIIFAAVSMVVLPKLTKWWERPLWQAPSPEVSNAPAPAG